VVKEIQLRVIEAKPDDAGTGKARLSENTLNSLSLKEGDVIEVKGKRITVVTVWKSLLEDQDDDTVRIDGLIRKNADIALNEYVTIKKADVKNAKSILLASVDMKFGHDRNYKKRIEKRIKLQLLKTPLLKDDSILLDFTGESRPFKVLLTEPTGIVKVCEATKLQVINQRYSDVREIMLETFTFLRFRFLKEVEKKLSSDYTRFRVPELIEHENEGEVLTEAKKRAKNINESIKVFVDLWEKRGKIVTLEWATVKPDSTVEYIYDFQKFKAISTEERDELKTVDLLINTFKDHERMLNELFNKLIRQIEALDEKLKVEKE